MESILNYPCLCLINQNAFFFDRYIDRQTDRPVFLPQTVQQSISVVTPDVSLHSSSLGGKSKPPWNNKQFPAHPLTDFPQTHFYTAYCTKTTPHTLTQAKPCLGQSSHNSTAAESQQGGDNEVVYYVLLTNMMICTSHCAVRVIADSMGFFFLSAINIVIKKIHFTVRHFLHTNDTAVVKVIKHY